MHGLGLTSYRSGSTSCACCPELARRLRNSASFKSGFSRGIFGV